MTTILVVDDHDDVRQSMVIRLEKHGFEVLVAKNGREAIESVRASKPALVLMDMNMPDVDGWEASSVIKADPEIKDTPIIALTAYKPVDLTKLLEQIRELLESDRSVSEDVT